MPRPTIRSIALAAKVSNCTVSRALRGDTHLSAGTRERIQGLAHEMGYQINAYVSSWMAHVRSSKTDISHQGCLAYLNCLKTNSPLTAFDTPRRQLSGATARASELGYRIEQLAVYRDALTAPRIHQILHARAIKGILLPVSGQFEAINLPFDLYACVAIGHQITNPAVHFTSADHHTMICKACDELAKLGYRRTGLVIPDDTDRRLELRPSSAYLGWQHRLPKARQIPILMQDGDVGDTEKRFVEWCRRYRVDSLLGIDASSGVKSIRTVAERNFRVPEEIALVTLDWHNAKAGVAGIDQQHELVGAAAVDILVHMLNNNVYGIPDTPRTTLVEGVWRPGASAPPRA